LLKGIFQLQKVNQEVAQEVAQEVHLVVVGALVLTGKMAKGAGHR